MKKIKYFNTYELTDYSKLEQSRNKYDLIKAENVKITVSAKKSVHSINLCIESLKLGRLSNIRFVQKNRPT